MPAASTTASSTSPRHRDKRPFQPNITSFFARDDRDSLAFDERGSGPNTRTRDPHNPQLRAALAPQIPPPVQASLLNVGMRVRKSVPEGYKTHKSATLPSIQTTISGPQTNRSQSADVYSVKPPRDAVPDEFQHPRELLPFCGLNKIGGFAEQPVTNPHLYGGDGASKPVNIFPLPAEAFNTPFSSHSSTASSNFSTDSAPARNPNNKRQYEEEDGKTFNSNSNFLFAFQVGVAEDEAPVSPLSASPQNSILNPPLRPFAQPKTRRAQGQMVDIHGTVLKEHGMDIDLENAEGTTPDEQDRNDFGEADFLRPWGSPGREVEMGGV